MNDAAPPAPADYHKTGAKLGTAALGFVVAIVGTITLQPFRFAWPAAVSLTWWDSWFDAVANVALFVPLGFLYALRRAARPGPAAHAAAAWRALALGAAASAAIELTQVFEPGRYPSPLDVATNAFGAALGAWLHARAARGLGADTPLVGRLALELPVMGLVYVALPLCTLAGLTIADAAGAHVGTFAVRGAGLLTLAAFGGALLGTVQRRQLGPAGASTATTMAAIGAAWFAVGALPALATAPAVFGAGVALAAATAWDVGRRTPDARPIERRFEAEALARAAPFLAAYLLLLPLGDPPAAVAAFSTLGLLRDVETLAAFTVGGYVLAEAWGRRELRYRFTAWRVGAAATWGVVALAALRAWLGRTAPGAAGVAALVAAAAYGGWIYHLQRAHVQALVAARRARGARPPANVGRDGRRERVAA